MKIYSAIVLFFLILWGAYIDMQKWAILKRSHWKVSDTQANVKASGRIAISQQWVETF